MKTQKFVAAALATMFGASVIMTGCGSIDSNATLITINGGEQTVSLGYGNFAARYQQALYDQYLLAYYGEGMWTSEMSDSGENFQEDVKADVIDTIEDEYLCKAHAAEYGVELTSDDEAAIAAAADKFLAANPENTLKALGATDEIVKQFLENRTYYTLVSKAAKESAGIQVSDDECWQRTFSYVRFDTTGSKDADGNLVEYTDAEVAELLVNASQLAAADDFDATAEALGVNVSTHSYTKGSTEDSFDEAVISAAEKLKKEGSVSDVIDVEGDGYYVLRLDADHDTDASESKRQSLTTTRENEFFTELLQSWKDETTFSVDEKAWSNVEFGTLFSAMPAEDDAEAEK